MKEESAAVVNAGGGGEAKRVASDTRRWTSGLVSFAVIAIDGHPEKSYIKFSKDVIGRAPLAGGVQRFNLRLRDWSTLKRLVEVELAEQHGWILENAGLHLITTDAKELVRFLDDNPGLIEKVLELPNLKNLSRESFESLNKLAMRVYVVQSRHVETILQKLAEASDRDVVQFAALLRSLRLGQIAALANLVRQKLQIIGLFRTLTSSAQTREREVHRLIENNIWIADKRYDVVASDVSLAQYLEENVGNDPELKRRPDLIVKRVPHEEQFVLIELKRPGIPLRGAHIGQVLEYKALIRRYRPNVRGIDCYLFGYEKHPNCDESNDVKIRTFSELSAALEDEYREYLKVLEGAEREEAAEDPPF